MHASVTAPPLDNKRAWPRHRRDPDVDKVLPQLNGAVYIRCTMFSPRFRLEDNSHVVGCRFWDRFPDDHDSYFAGEGIEDYAVCTGLPNSTTRANYALETRVLCLMS